MRLGIYFRFILDPVHILFRTVSALFLIASKWDTSLDLETLLLAFISIPLRTTFLLEVPWLVLALLRFPFGRFGYLRFHFE